MDLLQAERQLEELERWIPRLALYALEQAAKEGVQFARFFSSGPFSQAQLTAMDHPYAKRHGSPQINPEIINAQSGAFRSHWGVENRSAATRSLDRGGPVITNRDEAAEYLRTGTRTMFRRGIDDAIVRHLEHTTPQILDRELRRLRISL